MNKGKHIISVTLILLSSLSLSAQNELQDTLRASVVTGLQRMQLETGRILATQKSIMSVASPLGEGDPIRWVQNLPGVSTGADGTSAVYVRGGNMGGNLITIDGVPIYGYSHLLGLTMAVPNNAIESVSLAKGGFGGNSGNFSSSHIAISTTQPNQDQVNSSIFVNNFLAGANVSGPASDKLSYSVSGRISPLGAEYSALKGLMDGSFGGLDHFRAGVGDLYGKLVWKAGDREIVTASALATLDRYGFNMPDGSDEKMGWHNLIGAVQYHSDKIDGGSDLSLSYNSYGSTQDLSNEFRGSVDHFSLKSMLDEVVASADRVTNRDNGIVLKRGGSIRYASFRPGKVAGAVNLKQTLMASGYLQIIHDSGKLRWESTLRPTVFRSDTTMFSLDINLKGKWQVLPFLKLEATADAMSQYYHTLEGLPVGWSMDVLVPSVKNIPAEQMLQGYAGLEMVFGKHLFTTGAYIKELNNVIYYKQARNMFNSGISSWQSDVDCGKGDSKGMELMYMYQGNDVWVQASVTVSKSNRKSFPQVNGGKPFHAPFDRRLVGNLSAQWKGVSLNFTWQDGNWVNGRGERYTVIGPKENEIQLEYYSSVNNHQMPTLIRLDLGYQVKWQRERTSHELNIGIFNVLNHFNPFTVYYNTMTDSWTELALIPILPNVRYQINF